MSALYESFNDNFDQFDHLPLKLYKHDLSGEFIWAPLHWHRSIELLVTFEGCQIVNVGSDNFNFSGDDWLIINSSELHSTRYNDISDHFRGISVIFDLSFIETWIGKNTFFFNPHIEEVTKQIKKIAKNFYELEEDQPMYQLHMMKNTYDLMLLISEHCINKEKLYSPPFSKDQYKVTEFLEYIEQNYCDTLSLNNIADHFKYSPGYFSRYFKDIIGVNYIDYLNFVRTHHAAQQLLETQSTLTECALKNGFPNVKSFINTFKKIYGCTPKKFLTR